MKREWSIRLVVSLIGLLLFLLAPQLVSLGISKWLILLLTIALYGICLRFVKSNQNSFVHFVVVSLLFVFWLYFPDQKDIAAIIYLTGQFLQLWISRE